MPLLRAKSAILVDISISIEARSFKLGQLIEDDTHVSILIGEN